MANVSGAGEVRFFEGGGAVAWVMIEGGAADLERLASVTVASAAAPARKDEAIPDISISRPIRMRQLVASEIVPEVTEKNTDRGHRDGSLFVSDWRENMVGP